MAGKTLILSTEIPISSLVWKASDTSVAVRVYTFRPFPEPPLEGDVDRDGALDAFDLDLISAELLQSAPRAEFDFDGDVSRIGLD